MALLIEKTVAEVIQAVRLNGTIWVQTNWGSGSIKVAKSAALAELSRLPLAIIYVTYRR